MPHHSNFSSTPATNYAPLIRKFCVALAALTFWELVHPLNFHFPAHEAFLSDLRVGRIDAVGNFLLMIPWTLTLGWLGHELARTMRAASLWGLFGGAAMSLCAETLQMWLPNRHSSAVDLLTNSAGAWFGAWLGYLLARKLTHRLKKARRLIDGWRWSKRFAWTLLAVICVRWAPFDLEPQTAEIKNNFYNGTYRAGGPFSKTLHWLDQAMIAGPMRDAALIEMALALLDLAAFAVLAFVLGRSIREHFETKGDRSSPALAVLIICGMLALFTAPVQWVIHSRTLTATGILAGLAGVVVGLIADALAGEVEDS